MSKVDIQTEQLIQIGSRCDLFVDQRAEAWGRRPDGDRRCMRIHAGLFEDFLRESYYAEHKAAVTSPTAMRSAIATLASKAVAGGGRHSLEPRFNMVKDAIFIDLCRGDGAAVEVTKNGWKVTIPSTPLFRRFSHMKELPEPVGGGNWKDFGALMNLRDEHDLVLVLSWVVAAFVPGAPKPILVLHGTAGAAKSTAARFLRRLLDPSEAELLTLKRNEAELAQQLDHHAVPALDNLGRLTPAEADNLCRAVTGGALSKRKLRTDDEDVIFTYRRPVILSAINFPSGQPDLLDRMLPIEMLRVEAESRRSERELFERFEQIKSSVFGVLLDALVHVLAHQADFELPELERMADFHRLGALAARGLGFSVEKFDSAFRQRMNGQAWEAVEDDPVARTLVKMGTQESKPWDGTMAELLGALNARANATEKRNLPRTPAALGRRIRALTGALRIAGVSTDFRIRHGADGRRVCISWAHHREIDGRGESDAYGPGAEASVTM